MNYYSIMRVTLLLGGTALALLLISSVKKAVVAGAALDPPQEIEVYIERLNQCRLAFPRSNALDLHECATKGQRD